MRSKILQSDTETSKWCVEMPRNQDRKICVYQETGLEESWCQSLQPWKWSWCSGGYVRRHVQSSYLQKLNCGGFYWNIALLTGKDCFDDCLVTLHLKVNKHSNNPNIWRTGKWEDTITFWNSEKSTNKQISWTSIYMSMWEFDENSIPWIYN